ncbi:hypothetical protein [Streptomyces sp. NPDC127039]|uniref:hypothetical protein n=1 Tax=Streptomyces sp. NPDC127039 TaxID=3347115 RepID=UPI003656384C
MRIGKGLGVLLSTGTLLAGALVGVGAGTASAAPSVYFTSDSHSNGLELAVHVNGHVAGYGDWFTDPVGSQPGDALAATDSWGDGYWIAANLDTGRVATTRGHNAPYSVTKTGNLPEGQWHKMWVCVGKGSWYRCSSKHSVHA